LVEHVTDFIDRTTIPVGCEEHTLLSRSYTADLKDIHIPIREDGVLPLVCLEVYSQGVSRFLEYLRTYIMIYIIPIEHSRAHLSLGVQRPSTPGSRGHFDAGVPISGYSQLS
jgi:hypothetical protein